MLPNEGFVTRALLVMAALALTAPATVATADDGVIIDVSGAKRGRYPIAVPVAVDSDGAVAAEVAAVASFDLGVAGYFKVLDPASFLADLGAEKLGIDPAKWKDVGAYGVIKYRVVATGDKIDLEARLFEVSKGNSAVLTKTYRGSKADLRKLTHAWCNEVVKYYTGEYGFFGSRIAYVAKKRGASQVMVADFDGANPYGVTRNSSTNVLPAWSPGGGSIAFTSYMRNNPDLYVVGAGGGRPKKLASYKGMNTGASWSPDGSKIAVTLSKDGNPDIYVISASDGAILTRINAQQPVFGAALRAARLKYRVRKDSGWQSSALADDAASKRALLEAMGLDATGLAANDDLGVTISTIHASKGLEFKHVFLIGCSEGLLPYGSPETGDALEEERRLMYVGITRAEDSLHLSYARTKDGYGAQRRRPSRFL